MPKTITVNNEEKELEQDFAAEKEKIFKEIREQAEKEAKEIILKAIEEAKKAEHKEETDIPESKLAMKKQSAYLNERVPIEFFKGGSEFQNDVFVGVNDYSALIKRGEPVMVPRYVAMLIAESRAQEVKANDIIDEYIKRYEESRTKYGI